MRTAVCTRRGMNNLGCSVSIGTWERHLPIVEAVSVILVLGQVVHKVDDVCIEIFPRDIGFNQHNSPT